MFTLFVYGGNAGDCYADVRGLHGREFKSKREAAKAVKAAFGPCFNVEETIFEKQLETTINGFRFVVEEF